MEDIFGYSDDLAVAQYGEGAQRGRPIEILEQVVQSIPSPDVVDRLIRLYVERQRSIESHFKRSGADFQIIRAHGRGVLRTAWNVVRTFARARRLGEASGVLATLTGFGDDADLRTRLGAAMARGANADDWVQLAAAFRSGEDGEDADLVAAFAITFEATRRFPRAPEPHLAAAEDARQLGSIPLATWLYETGLDLQPNNREAAENLLRLYELHIATFSQNDRPSAARDALTRFETLHAVASKRWPKALRPDLAEVYATMGRGLLSQGNVDGAQKLLSRSIRLRATLGALESLGTLELKRDNFREAIGHFQRALDLPVEDLTSEFNRIKILRAIGEAYEGSGNAAAARRTFERALRAWNALAAKADFRMPYVAEALLENGKLEWHLGRRDAALTRFEEAVDVDVDGAGTHADVVAFLIVRGEYDRALDAYHRALGSHDIGEYFKVYMSLWVVAEARRSGRSEDPLALGYLAQRDGRLWYDQQARFASGRGGADALVSRANTRGRRAEMLYYTGVLGADARKRRGLLRDVLETDMILFFEYDMAKYWLEQESVTSKP
jgi:tetratricopeptide (TPR) repeat protein